MFLLPLYIFAIPPDHSHPISLDTFGYIRKLSPKLDWRFDGGIAPPSGDASSNNSYPILLPNVIGGMFIFDQICILADTGITCFAPSDRSLCLASLHSSALARDIRLVYYNSCSLSNVGIIFPLIVLHSHVLRLFCPNDFLRLSHPRGHP